DPGLRSGPSLRGVRAKWRQMRAARALERSLSKDEILEAYLNLASFRGELQGVAAASRGLFGREPHGLREADAAVPAALLPAPNAAEDEVAARACRIAALRAGDADCDAVRARTAAALAGELRAAAGPALAPHLAARLLRPAAAGVPTRSSVTTT